MAGVTRLQLAHRAGVTVDYIDRLVDLTILTTGDSDAPFSDGDVRKARFVQSLDRGGLLVEAIGAAVKNGDLSLAFFGAPACARFGGLTPKTLGELSAETGVSVELLQIIRESMGFARPEPDDLVREDEMDLVTLVQRGLAAGADPEALARQVRVWGESVRRIAEADGQFYHSQIEVPLLRAGMPQSQMMEIGTEAAALMTPVLDGALVSLYHAQSEHTWMANVVEAVEATLERAGLHRKITEPPAICFLDLTGFTRLTEERGDEAAAELAATLGQLVQRSASAHGGRAIKWLGDGVMLHFKQPGGAVTSALELVEGIPTAGLPPAHVGIHAGPVILQDGDYFGRTVNAAARIAAHARGHQVLVTDDVMQATAEPDVRFVEVGPVELRGMARPIRLHRALRVS